MEVASRRNLQRQRSSPSPTVKALRLRIAWAVLTKANPYHAGAAA